MALIDAFLTETATIQPYIRQGAGHALYGEAQTRSCRIEMQAHLMTSYKNASGQIDQVEARAKMFCTGDPIPADSLVTYNDETYKVINCEIMRGFGYSHLEVYLM